MAIDHYENFPVASWLCPRRLRPAEVAIYHFARTADDIADEGDASPAARLTELAAYRAHLYAAAEGVVASERWSHVFAPLGSAITRFGLPLHLLAGLLSAFEQDARQPRYPDRASLLDYCARSANPVGRLMLHLYGVHDAAAQRESDCVCTALQLANFWQDLSVDTARRRYYVPEADCRRHGVAQQPNWQRDNAGTCAVIMDLAGWARSMMLSGAPLVHRIGGSVGWELRLVVQGGLRILDKVEALGGATLGERPTLRALDTPLLLWRSLRMAAPPSTPTAARSQ